MLLTAARWIGTTGSDFANRAFMTKILLLLILAMMVVHIIKPLGLPGLRRRADFWKLALIALAAVSLTILLRGGE